MHSEGKDQEACPRLQELLQGHVSQQGGPSHRGPETFWQGQTCSGLTEKGRKKRTGPSPAGLQSGLGSTMVAPSLSGDACMRVHTPRPTPLPVAQGLVWSPPREALASSLS